MYYGDKYSENEFFNSPVAINLVHEVNYRIKDYCREWKTYWIKIKLVMII
jgi:hypothetical protein